MLVQQVIHMAGLPDVVRYYTNMLYSKANLPLVWWKNGCMSLGLQDGITLIHVRREEPGPF